MPRNETKGLIDFVRILLLMRNLLKVSRRRQPGHAVPVGEYADSMISFSAAYLERDREQCRTFTSLASCQLLIQ